MGSAPAARVIRAVIVDDDVRLLGVIKRGLRLHGFDVTTFPDPQEALEYLENRKADVVVLDVMMPDLDGVSLCRRLRQTLPIPILMLSARDTVPDRILGLESGADDYVTKPFEIAELAARLRALIRRTERETPDERLSYADVAIDMRRHIVTRGGEALSLTPTEYRLLEYFMRNAEAVIGRDAVLVNVWGYEGGESNYLDVHVGHLREKLEAGGRPRLIQTVRSFGYALRQN
ncbi:MAG: response regulator transcription factor [Chloroflexota bacterium]|nr:response regulator transcription factor [Chloroflexota bacterium]